jgi:uncharacterized protein YciI
MPRRIDVDFDTFTLVLLVDGPAEPLPEAEAAALQDRHLAYLASLRDAGSLIGAGPSRAEWRPDLRGLSLFALDLEDARRLAEADPAVMAGVFRVELMRWTVPASGLVAGPGRFPRSTADVTGG